MKLVSYRAADGAAYGAVVGNRIAGLSARLPYPGLKQALAHTGEIEAALAAAPPTVALDAVELLPPIPDPAHIICIGRNFKGAMKQMGLDHLAYPVLFTRFAHSQVGHRQPIVRPRVSSHFDYEGELAVIIGKPGRHIGIDRALEHVAGYTCYNDGSVRDYQRHTTQDTPGKNFWRSGAAGPWLVTADEIPDPARLTLTTRLNGAVVQQDHLSDLLFDVPSVIAYLSSIFPLESGDTIAMGTPLGVGLNAVPPRWLVPGDEVSVEIDGIGTLTNHVIDETTAAA